jgi:poly[(R)-3-hydroxyalkanoate] polymerase subunit PhaC
MPPLALVETKAPEPAPSPPEPQAASQPPESPFEIMDRMAHAAIARLTAGLSPAALQAAYFDWAANLMMAPGKQLDLIRAAASAATGNLSFLVDCLEKHDCDPCECARPQDKRFRAPEWRMMPFNVYAHSFLAIEQWWEAATTNIGGLSKHHQAMASFAARQILDMMAPSNFIATNPQVIQRTRSQLGTNLQQGFENFMQDLMRDLSGAPPLALEQFKVGKDVAASPGAVVRRTHLAEIIQYKPTTDKVRPEPVVIVPAWIMKYYILDLSPHNSLVKYLTDQGFTVFMISWKNPGENERDTGFDEYRSAGVLAAIDAAKAITGSDKVHGVGYCLGGTLLAIAAAAMNRDGDGSLASLSFFAAQTDFEDAGELRLFINESQVRFLEDMMWERGYLDARQMAGTFQVLRSNDLIWSRNIQEYLLGERPKPFDIMAWSADSTRMPYRMHSDYLRRLFLDNDLAEGRFKVDGRPVALLDIRQPLFVVATERDHIAPWRSVFKFHTLTDTEITFVLTSGGHNGGIVSEPGHPHHAFRISRQERGANRADPDSWIAGHRPQPGSWWPAWTDWLRARSGEPVAPPPLGNPGAGYRPLEAAPGSYVLMR